MNHTRSLVAIAVSLNFLTLNSHTFSARGAEPHVYRQNSIPGTQAPPFRPPPVRANLAPPPTNGVVSPAAKRLVSTLKREIQLTDSGAQAIWGRTKVFFPATLENPVKVITPEGRHLSFRPTFLVLENRATQETVLLGTVTNRDVGTIYPSANSVIWTNIFDSGPQVSLELVYDGFTGKLEQNLLVQESLGPLPNGWVVGDVALECWTAWRGDTQPANVQSRTIELRPASATNPPVNASDSTVSFQSSRITAGGKAFSVDSDSPPLPVAKSWLPADATDVSPPTSFLIEAVDLLSAQPQIQTLPAPVRQSRLELRKRSRAELALLQPKFSTQPPRTASVSNRRMLVAKAPPSPLTPDTRHSLDTRHSSVRPSPLKPGTSFASVLPGPAFAIDFTLSEAVPLPSGAISWWQAEGSVRDALTNHNDGTEYNGVAYVAGEVGRAFSLDGNAAHAHVPDSPSLHVTNVVTIEAWVNPASMDEPWYRDIVGKWDLTGGLQQRSYDFSLAPDNSAYIVVTSNGDDSGASWVMTTNAVPFDTWTHIAGVYDGSALRMYVNGSPDVVGAYSSGIFPGTNDLGIGGCVGGGSPGDVLSPFNGGIDEPSLYARALSATEIQAIYNAGPAGKINPVCIEPSTNVVAWWPADGNAYDIAHTNFGVMRNGATFARGVVGQAFSFDGVSNYVRIENNFDLNPSAQITIEAWVNLQSDPASDYAVMRKDGECENRQFMLTAVHGDLGHIGFRAHVGIQGGGYNYIDSETEITTGTWYHVAEVYDGTNLSIYVNGMLDASASLNGTILSTTEPIFIGGSQGYCWNYGFPGLIDEPTIYDRALSDTEIANIYAAGCAGKCKNFAPGDLFTDLQNSFLGLSSPDADSDGVPNGVEFYQGRNPRAAGAIADTNSLINLQVYTPLK